MDKPLKPFSIRFRKAILDRTLKVSFAPRVRNRLWKVLQSYNWDTLHDDGWRSDLVWDVLSDLKRCHGWDELQIRQQDGNFTTVKDHGEFIRECYPSQVFDILEIATHHLGNSAAQFIREVNAVLETEEVPWRLLEDEFIQLDTQFLALFTASTLQEMKSHGFEGALQEFKEARNDLISGDTKGAIHNACKSMESILQTILKITDANADRLLKALLESGFLNDLPENRREGFRQQVMKTLPSMRNAYGGHGQGETPVEIPRVYGDLAVNLAATFNHFLITKHIASLPPPVPTPMPSENEVEDDLPF